MSNKWRNQNGKMKALLIHVPPEKFLYIEDVQQIAKSEALKIGMAKRKELLRLPCEPIYIPQIHAYVVVVQSVW